LALDQIRIPDGASRAITPAAEIVSATGRDMVYDKKPSIDQAVRKRLVERYFAKDSRVPR